METVATNSTASAQKSPSYVDAQATFNEDSRSETSTVESDDVDLTFFTRLYQIPLINDTVSSIYRIAESNRYTSSIISYAEKAGEGFAEKSRPLLRPVEKPLAVIDGYASRSLDFIENRYPIVSKPTDQVIESVQNSAKAVENRYPLVARTFAVARSTANSALDRVDYLVDYVLPATPAAAAATDADPKDGDAGADVETSKTDDPTAAATAATAAATTAEPGSAADVESTLGKITVLVHKVPHRLGQAYYNRLESSKSAISGMRQSVKDTVTVYESELADRSSKLLGSVQDRVKETAKATVNTAIPSILPRFAQPYYEHSKDLLATKAEKLHAEYTRTDEDARTKVLNLILIGGEQVPVLERITSRIYSKGIGTDQSPGDDQPGATDQVSVDQLAASAVSAANSSAEIDQPSSASVSSAAISYEKEVEEGAEESL
ncbi:hypothetical protein GGI07_003593 [Coemansia sp. Benny D115]|nr:hypothetical protein GGI07_003593 [Coemansia sp. Benny D115]